MPKHKLQSQPTAISDVCRSRSPKTNPGRPTQPIRKPTMDTPTATLPQACVDQPPSMASNFAAGSGGRAGRWCCPGSVRQGAAQVNLGWPAFVLCLHPPPCCWRRRFQMVGPMSPGIVDLDAILPKQCALAPARGGRPQGGGGNGRPADDMQTLQPLRAVGGGGGRAAVKRWSTAPSAQARGRPARLVVADDIIDEADEIYIDSPPTPENDIEFVHARIVQHDEPTWRWSRSNSASLSPCVRLGQLRAHHGDWWPSAAPSAALDPTAGMVSADRSIERPDPAPPTRASTPC